VVPSQRKLLSRSGYFLSVDFLSVDFLSVDVPLAGVGLGVGELLPEESFDFDSLAALSSFRSFLSLADSPPPDLA